MFVLFDLLKSKHVEMINKMEVAYFPIKLQVFLYLFIILILLSHASYKSRLK